MECSHLQPITKQVNSFCQIIYPTRNVITFYARSSYYADTGSLDVFTSQGYSGLENDIGEATRG